MNDRVKNRRCVAQHVRNASRPSEVTFRLVKFSVTDPLHVFLAR